MRPACSSPRFCWDPFPSLIISKVFYHTDLREHGSGNIGTTNAIRTMGKVGATPCSFWTSARVCCQAFCLGVQLVVPARGRLRTRCAGHVRHHAGRGVPRLRVGHIFCPWLGFKGGKGIAVAVGCLFVTFGWIGACLELLIFIVLVATTKRVSIGSIAAAAACPFFALYFFWGDWLAWLFCTVAGLTVVWAHRENIKRLRAGTESRTRRQGARRKGA